MLLEDLSVGTYTNYAIQASTAKFNGFQQCLVVSPRQSNEKVVSYVAVGVYCLDVGIVVFCRRRDFSRNHTKDAAAAPHLSLQHQSNLLERSFCAHAPCFFKKSSYRETSIEVHHLVLWLLHLEDEHGPTCLALIHVDGGDHTVLADQKNFAVSLIRLVHLKAPWVFERAYHRPSTESQDD